MEGEQIKAPRETPEQQRETHFFSSLLLKKPLIPFATVEFY